MESFKVKRDNDRPLVFTGEPLASASSKDPYGRWTVLSLYKTASNKYIVEKEHITCWQGEENRYEGFICNNEEEVIEHLGLSNLAKEVYEDAKIECVEQVD